MPAMNTVAQIFARKGSNVVAVPGNTTVLDALRLMAEKNIGSVVVTDADGQFEGIITERDYSRKVILKGKSSTDTTVEEIMSTDLPHVNLKHTVEHCMELMTRNNIRYLPVFSGSDLEGIISMSDVVKQTILLQQETISHLQHYISQ
jgi:CBS domain-containing protein